METLIFYIVKVNIALAVFYLLYVLFLRKDTFIRLRRYYFLSAIIFSLAYPLFTVTALGNLMDFRSAAPKTETFVMIGELSMGEMIIDDLEEVTTPIDWTAVAKNILLAGVILLSLRFVWQLCSIFHIKRRSEKRNLFGHPIYHLSDEITPFSFFKWIFIHTEKHSEVELRQILLHEQTHVQQWHSLDVMLMEMVCILFWYNPTVWLMKRDMAINLEYLADNAVLQEGIDTQQYQYHLLQLTYHESAVRIVNNFNVPQLKQRIIMMNTNKSPIRKLAKYLSVLPLALLLITANSLYAQTNETQQETTPPQEPQKKESKSNEIFVVVEQQPAFPGGTKGLMEWLGANIQYPKEAHEKGIEGRVIVNFVVEKDGSISDVNIVRGQDPLLDAEATRVVPLMPKWTPGVQKGETVRVKYTLPIVFKIPEIETNGSTVIGHKQSYNKQSEENKDDEFIVMQGSGSMKDVTPQTLAEKFGKNKPIYFLDGERIEDIESIDPKNIESISVLKDEKAIAKYGEAGKNGVLEITSKSAVAKSAAMHAAKDKLGKSPDEVFVVVEDQPQYPGGTQALMNFIGENVRYPAEAQENGIQGRVIVNFIVNKDGSLSDLKVVRGQDPSLDAEAIRVIATMPNWKPGMQRGEAVNVRYTLPIVFRLEGDKSDKEALSKLTEKGAVTVTDMKNDAPDKTFHKFIGENVKYPVIAQENGIMGVVRATYDVNANGEISNIKITESADPALSAELIRVIKLMPKDIALIKSGGKAASNAEISALFRLQNDSSTPPPPPPPPVKSDIVVVGYGKPAK